MAKDEVVGVDGLTRESDDRERSEPALADLAERLALATRSARIGIWDWNVVANELVWDERMFELYGVQRAQFSGAYDAWVAGLHPGDRMFAEQCIQRALRDEAPYDIEFRVRWPDGTVRIIKADGHVVRDANGQALRMLGTNYDVTDRKQAEATMHESEVMLAHAQEMTHTGSWAWELANGQVTWSEELYRIYGLVPDGQPMTFARAMACTHPDDAARITEQTRAQLAGKELGYFEYRIVRPDGALRWVWARSDLSRDSAGQPQKMRGTIQDITDRKLAEQALRDSEERYRTIVETAHEGIWTIDGEGRTNFVNRKLAEILRYTVEEMLGRPLFDFMDDEGRAIAAQNLERRKAGIAEQHDFKFQRKDGTAIWAELNTTPLYDSTGAYAGALAMVTDITERKRTEQALRDSEALLNKAQEVAHFGSFDWNVTTNAVTWSRETYVLFGEDPDHPSADIWTILARALPPDDQERLEYAMNRVKAGIREPMELQVRWPDHSEHVLWCEGEIQPDAAGLPSRMVGVMQDITERKRSEESLLQIARGVSTSSGEQFFQSLVSHLARALHAEIAFVGALTPGGDGSIRTIAVQADGELVKNFDYALAGTPCVNVMGKATCSYPRDVQSLFPDDQMLVEMRAQAYVGTPLFKSDGAPLGVVAVLFRQPVAREAAIISALEIFGSRASHELERLQAEPQMRKLSSAVEQTADVVIITDRHGVIEYVNPAFERGTGYSSAEALGQTPRLVRSDKQGDGFFRKLWSTILAGEVFSDVLVNRRKDGSFYYEEKTITPLKDAQGNVTHFISTGKDVTERMQTQEKLEFMAQHDALTKLPNRVLLLDRLTQSVARARWRQRMVAVLFVDLDRFKTINDTLGHEAGDQLLQQLGARFSHNVREGDTVARFGGDEFIILLSDVANDKDSVQVAQKILDALKAPFLIQNQSLYITASIGISLAPNDGEDAATLLKHADIAMYRAKELGKNTYQFYSAEMSARAFERLSLENSLRHALERNEFVLHYQPQFDVTTGRIFGVEALLRWQHPDFGLVPPADFISLLEETGLIVPTGEWVLEAAGRQMQAWHVAGHRQLQLAVNLSPRQVLSGALLETVRRVLKYIPDKTGWLELEITEGLLVQQSQALMETFDTLRALGVKLAVDDFGTGYSSLAYLRRLPIDSLKIDRSFVRDVPGDADDSAITTTIIAMARSLRLEVIAEGVENAAQRDFLSAHGCQRMQGYLFARPVPPQGLSRMLEDAASELAPG